MQVSVESTSAIERRMTIGVPAERFESEVNKRLQRTAKQAKIPGFRPGKAPMSIIRQRYEEGVRQDVMGDLINSTFYEALMAEKINPAGAPSIEAKTFEKDKDFEYVATFEVYPEFEVAGLETIEVERLQAEVADSDVDNMLDILRKQNTRFTDVDRAAENGDQINIDFVGKIDGEVFAGGSAQGVPLVLGSGNMIPGFEEPLIGCKAGDEKVITPTFPENYQNLDLAGKQAEFSVKVNAVQAPELPEMDDEFFTLFGHTEGGLEGFRAEVAKNMGRELKAALKGKVKTQVFDALLETNQIEVPKAQIESEINRLRTQAVQQFGGNVKPEQLPADMFAAQAERRVALGLVVAQMIKQFDIKAEDEVVRSTIEDMASAYQDPQQVIDWYNQNEEQLEEVRASVLEDQVVEAVLAKAKVTDKKVSYEEAVNTAAPQAAED
ncbi:MAG: trigger factor [Thiopseudomonas sp.]|nr:trigger factor [Thiopseudomonas sp.]MCK9465700.1 trigger factor [Thiopseudomonas sp.]